MTCLSGILSESENKSDISKFRFLLAWKETAYNEIRKENNGGKTMITETIQLYEDREDITLSAYVLSDSAELLAGKKRPAILICPGGGYFNCSEREAEPIALRFTGMGYHAFVLRYAVYGVEGGFPDLSKPFVKKEENVHPRPMNDIAEAMRFIASKEEEWLVDKDRIAVCGFSAGGHNAAMYATRWHENPDNIRPAAAILGYPLTDYVFKHEYESRQEGPITMFFHASDTIFLGTAEPGKELLEEVSPARNVDEHTPPMYLWATSEDELVPVQHSLIMARALADAKVPFELHIFEKGPHGLGTADEAGAGALSQCFEDAAKWVDLSGAWLKKRFALPLPKMTEWEEMMASGKFPGF